MRSYQKYKIGTKVKKAFDGVFYNGIVVSYKQTKQWYKVRYEDDDAEELAEEELEKILVPTTPSSKGKRKTKSNRSFSKKIKLEDSSTKNSEHVNTCRSADIRIISPNDLDNDDNAMDIDKEGKSADENVEIKDKVAVKPNVEAKNSRSRRNRKQINYFFGKGLGNSEEDSESDSNVDYRMKKKRVKATKGHDEAFQISDEPSEVSENESFDDDSLPETKPKRYVHKKKTPPSSKSAKEKTTTAAGKPKIKMSDAFQPISTPMYKKLSLAQIKKDKSFLDPCGMEATDDIIDRLVGDQLDKIGSLLHRAIQSQDSESLKFNPFPLELGTACSGTDAPALALTLIQEQMQLRGHDFNFDHVFSCENEPFKQAYLARNFSSILYPDITKLPLDDSPRDVFGQPKPIPPFNMFVAGTSCKNFSMLRSRYRIDIEDKGCSGETFLAATEILFKEQPHFAIFENVIGAPWIKMKEYITGRVRLSQCDDKKAVKMDAKDKKKDLIFCLDEDENIIVDQVPSVYGVRCGSKVKGFLKGDSSQDIKPIVWPKSQKKNTSTCTLKELMEKNKIIKKTDTLVFDTPCTYCTHTLKVDTKEYGLPQTRMRTYMFVWKPEDGSVDDDLGEYWEAIVKFVKSPVRHSLESFILQVDHDVIRVFREALNGPPGRQTKRGHFMEPDFWTSTKADLRHNKIARERLGFEDMKRTLTNWVRILTVLQN